MYIVIFKDEEIYKDLTYPEIEDNRYLISNYGVIYDKKTDKYRTNTVHKQNGYVVCKLKLKDGTRKMRMVHRLVAWEFCEGYSEEKCLVNHLDSNKENIYYENLEWCTVSENNKHRFEHGNGGTNPPVLIGEQANGNIYKESFIHEICKSLEEGLGLMDIMKQNGYYAYKNNLKLYSLLYDIKRRKTWNHISKSYTWK